MRLISVGRVPAHGGVLSPNAQRADGCAWASCGESRTRTYRSAEIPTPRGHARGWRVGAMRADLFRGVAAAPNDNDVHPVRRTQTNSF